MRNIKNIELKYLTIEDYEHIKALMKKVYTSLTSSYWEEEEIALLISKFPEGQVVIKVDGVVAGCALSIIVDDKVYNEKQNYKQITGNYTFNTHTPKGNILYGVDVFIKPEFRGLRLGRRLYDYRKELCENLNLEKIAFGGRLPNYHKHAEQLTPKQYIDKVKLKEIHDPVLNFQLSNDFYIKKIIKNYMGDADSAGYAVLLEWNNIYYEEPTETPTLSKTVFRLGLVQWQMRPYASLKELLEQAEYFIDAVSGYRADFILFPEFFNAPLMAAYNHLSEPDSIRKLATYTEQIKNAFADFSIAYNINIITGSMPSVENGVLYNVGYLCERNGNIQKFYQLHITPDNTKAWGMTGGNVLRAYDTDCGKIGILISYDIQFPELSRILAEQEINILFVPFLTDTQNGYERVKNCAQARAIENECYVAIAGGVGNLPKVHNMDIQFAQSMVFTPCDFSFATDGIKAKATPNTEMILVADVDVSLLWELNQYGSVKNLENRRKDLYEVKLKSKMKKSEA